MTQNGFNDRFPENLASKDFWEAPYDHSKVKHKILERYLGSFLSIIGHTWKRFYIIDGFAGQGKYNNGEPGSPLISIETIYNILRKFKNNQLDEIHCIFIEKDKESMKILKENVKNAIDPSETRLILDFYNEEFSEAFSEIMLANSAGLSENPSLFFIDPCGYSQIPFEIYEKIFALSNNPMARPEVLVILMVNSMKRWCNEPEQQKNYEILFGQHWRQDIEKIMQDDKCNSKEEAFSTYFREQLESRTNARYTFRYKIHHSISNQWYYDIIHATTKFKGLEVMKEVLFNIDTIKGRFEYRGKTEKFLRKSTNLDKFYDLSKIKITKWLHENIISKDPVSFQDLNKYIVLNTQWIEKNLRQAILELEKLGEVKITRKTSKKIGLKGEDEIIFLQAKQTGLDQRFKTRFARLETQ